MNQHPIPKPSPTGGKGGSINFCVSSAIGAQLGLFLVLGLEGGQVDPISGAGAILR